MKKQIRQFGSINQKQMANIITLKNSSGMILEVSDFGARILSLKVMDKQGEFRDVVLGFSSLDEYINDSNYFGASIGRFANRISNGIFRIDNKKHFVSINEEEKKNHLHGGKSGFDKQLWDYQIISDQEVLFSYFSQDGEQGYPGNVKIRISFYLSDKNELHISYEADTDKVTPINLTNHSYFNLSGHGNGSILKSQLQINAKEFTPVNEQLQPLGKSESVINTPFDFLSLKNIEEQLFKKHQQLIFGDGFDHNFILNKANGDLENVARLECRESGIFMDILTTQPGLQLYTGNWIPDGLAGKDGVVYRPYSGICLETQHFPDSPNFPQFPSTLLYPEHSYKEKTIYAFSLIK